VGSEAARRRDDRASMSVRARECTCAALTLLLLLPGVARAQTLNGVAEWTVVSGGNYANDVPSAENGSFWQRYTLGYSTPVIDPRLMKCTAEGSFRTSSLNSGSGGEMQEGHQRDAAYKWGVQLFPARAFPFYIEMTRDAIGESGAYPTSNGIRGSVALPPGVPLPDFRTLNRSLNVGWQLNVATLPRVEFAYRSAESQVSGGPYDAEQSEGDVHVGVFEDTKRTRQSLRFQRTAFANAVSQVFNQRMTEFDYDFGATLGVRNRARARAGQRATFSQFDLPSIVVDPGTAGYSLPSRGDVGTRYVIGGFTYEPTGDFSVDISGNADRQDSQDVATSAKLATTTARYDPVRGLSLNASGTYGQRGQSIENVPITVMTRVAQAGASYRAGTRWLEGRIGGTRGIGSSQTPGGDSGALDSQSGQAGLSLSTPWINLNAGFDEAASRDDILVFGNYQSTRAYGSAQRDIGRASMSATFDDAVVQRGRGETLARNHQQTFTASASYRRRDHMWTANAGGFKNRSELGRDETLFSGAAYQGQLSRALRASAWLRLEHTSATETRLDQRNLASYGNLEYRYRQFRFGIEYRRNNQDLRYERLVNPYVFRGEQWLIHLSRTFGVTF
jgi:hypothetical protein